MGLIAFVTKMAVIPVTVIADAMAITAVIAIMAVIPCMTMIDLMATMALMSIPNMMASASMTFTILHIFVIDAVEDMVIIAVISITTVLAIGYYGHKSLNGFRRYNFSSESSSCISSYDRNGNYDVLELMAKNI